MPVYESLLIMCELTRAVQFAAYGKTLGCQVSAVASVGFLAGFALQTHQETPGEGFLRRTPHRGLRLLSCACFLRKRSWGLRVPRPRASLRPAGPVNFRTWRRGSKPLSLMPELRDVGPASRWRGVWGDFAPANVRESPRSCRRARPVRPEAIISITSFVPFGLRRHSSPPTARPWGVRSQLPPRWVRT